MIKNILLSLTVGLALVACNKSEQDVEKAPAGNDTAAALAAVAEVQISVPTVQCGTCQSKVEKALQTLDGVKSAKVDLEAKVARVSFDPQKLNLAALENAITMAGYDANGAKRDSTAYAQLDPCCKLPEDR